MASRISDFFTHNRNTKLATAATAGLTSYLFYQSITDIDFSNGNFKYAAGKDVYMFLGANVLACVTIGLLIHLYCNRKQWFEPDPVAVSSTSNTSSPEDVKAPSGPIAGGKDPVLVYGFLCNTWGTNFKEEYKQFKQEVHNMNDLRTYGANRQYATRYTFGWEKICRTTDENFLIRLKEYLDGRPEQTPGSTPSNSTLG